jgi:hypothetical protein
MHNLALTTEANSQIFNSKHLECALMELFSVSESGKLKKGAKKLRPF